MGYEHRSSGEKYAGLSLLGAIVTGALSLLFALVAFLDYEWTAAGLALLAAALAFGLLANAVFRT